MATRFAPSTTGPAHPGTLLSALLCWLDARSRGDRIILRFEDLDPARCQPAYLDGMRAALEWFGLDWDREVVQSERAAAHRAALDSLQAQGRLYPCRCSRSRRRQSGRRSPDGGYAYGNTCRERALPAAGWAAAHEPLRVRLPAGRIELIDDLGVDLSQEPAIDMGDPIVVRRDGAIAYHLAVVVDDAAGIDDGDRIDRIDRIIRGRDLASSTATHIALQRLLGIATPRYLHHFLFLEPHGDKLAKFHNSVGIDELERHYGPEKLCGFIAWAAGLQSGTSFEPCRPGDLVPGFSWTRVRRRDAILRWQDRRLQLEEQTSPVRQ